MTDGNKFNRLRVKKKFQNKTMLSQKNQTKTAKANVNDSTFTQFRFSKIISLVKTTQKSNFFKTTFPQLKIFSKPKFRKAATYLFSFCFKQAKNFLKPKFAMQKIKKINVNVKKIQNLPTTQKLFAQPKSFVFRYGYENL